MKRILATILVIGIGALCAGLRLLPAQDRDSGSSASAPRGQEFFALDVFVDSGAVGLGAYQVEVTPRDGAHAQLVGIEGGDIAPFADPPAYDPAALHRTQGVGGFDRVILAAFSTDPPGPLPTGRTRVARLHFHVEGDAAPVFNVRLVAAGGKNADSIDATAHLRLVETNTNTNIPNDREGASR